MAKKIYEDGKRLLQSKTFWFNVLAVIVAVASLFGFGDFKPDNKVTEVIAILSAIINVLLRVKTSEQITKL